MGARCSDARKNPGRQSGAALWVLNRCSIIALSPSYQLLSENFMTQRIRGVLSPVVTPFKADLSPDTGRFIAHCKWLLSQNCGLAVFGTKSEANSLASDEP